ncbi:MAG: hypothetical protein AAGA77_04510 [Bacteroidota bacterium]
MKYKLNNTFTFAVEPYEKKARLVVFDGDDEFVCRKERIPVLNEFLELMEGKIFKGRLQLVKEQATINIIVKGDLAGSIAMNDFKREIEKLK